MPPTEQDGLEQDDASPATAGRVLICTFDPFHTVTRFERRLMRLWKRRPLGDDTQLFLMSEGLPLCAECKMLMESVAVPRGASAVTALRVVAENFSEAMSLTRTGLP